ncbi:uncharacterized protein LOC130742741 [Lotus japonicus]|uniref:uncharacterized protein LOC130742741 n=1 Tax=Lotus japonicus TaxID=34305 RepID=UPI002588D8D6|nr:uncharacterized protein LOC130742741 [Lotus japonicus]
MAVMQQAPHAVYTLGSVRVMVDGSWNPATLRMGCGIIVKDVFGNWVSGLSMSFGTSTTFVAEILAFEQGLKHCWDLGFKDVVCCTNCSGVQHVLHSMVVADSFWAREDIERVRALLRRDWKLLMVHIPRGSNTATDLLARQAARDGSSCRTWHLPPFNLNPLLLQNEVE